ncbi:hypothetical protein OHQ89_51565 [Streptomyces canus]|nr:hypothetical protein [Streptomyces canus]
MSPAWVVTAGSQSGNRLEAKGRGGRRNALYGLSTGRVDQLAKNK